LTLDPNQFNLTHGCTQPTSNSGYRLNKNIAVAIKSWPATALSREGGVCFYFASHHRCRQPTATVASCW